jgi:uncharacterized protein (DUF1778 family)
MRDATIILRTTKEFKQRIEKQAEANQQNISEFVRLVVLAAVRILEKEELKKTKQESGE